MAKKKKAAKKRTKRATGRTSKTMKKKATAAKKKKAVKKSAKRKAPAKKRAARRAPAAQVTWGTKKPPLSSGAQAGDLQGVSTRAGADSESVDELIEEGNAVEADVVADQLFQAQPALPPQLGIFLLGALLATRQSHHDDVEFLRKMWPGRVRHDRLNE